MYNDTITLFNFYEPLDVWIPHIIQNVNVDTDRAHIMKKYGPESGDNAELHIRYETRDITTYNQLCDSEGNVIADIDGNIITYGADIVTAEKIIADKIWTTPKEWQRNSMVEDRMTICPGDFFIKSEWTLSNQLYDNKGNAIGDNNGDIIAYGADVVKDSDYSDGRFDGFYAYMNATYDNVYIITIVNGPYKLIPHFEITGK